MADNEHVWRTRFFYIFPSPLDGRLVREEVGEGWIKQCRRVGYRVYTFQDQRIRKTTHIAVKTRQACYKFAVWGYETIGDEKTWEMISLSSQEKKSINELTDCLAQRVITSVETHAKETNRCLTEEKQQLKLL